MSEEKTPCRNTTNMTKWLSGENPDFCRSCLVGPAVSWYLDELKNQGQQERAEHLRTTAQKSDVTPTEIAREMDKIKSEVNLDLKKRLLDFDCSVQTFETQQK